jgi:hypothetical protein
MRQAQGQEGRAMSHPKRLLSLLAAVALAVALAPTQAEAAFGLHDIQVQFLDSEGEPVTQAGSHPFEMKTSFKVNTVDESGKIFTDGALRSLDVFQPPGFAGSPTAVPPCSTLDFLTRIQGFFSKCPNSSAVGYVVNTLATQGTVEDLVPRAVYNLEPPPGIAAKFGFWVNDIPIAVEVKVSPEYPNNVVAHLTETSQIVEVIGSQFVLWGNPADPDHDELRGRCLGPSGPTGDSCPADVLVKPFITLPRSCEGPLHTVFRAIPWWEGENPLDPQPGTEFVGEAVTPALTGCGKLRFAPRLSAQPTTAQASSPSGLAVSVEIEDEGLTSPTGTAHSDIHAAQVTLPEGMTVNPSQAEGLATCSPEDLSAETLSSVPGEGCPQASKIGAVEVESPLLEGELLRGAVFVATPHENRFGSLIALYVVIRHPELGILAKLEGKVVPDPSTGQLTTTFDRVPPLPVSRFALRLREGGRSPLISPPACGTYTTKALFSPSGNPASALPLTSSFQITAGPGGGPCPPAGPPPFDPGFSAGSINAQAGSHTPFFMRLTRRDGDQDLTRFDAILPPGLVGKLAGVSQCPDRLIAQIAARSGREELASPTCPANSRIGSVFAGAGAGSQLTYVPGSIYLAGPLGKAPLSVLAVVPAVAGPFDVGVVTTRQALDLDPVSAQVEVDGALSDPIPHILAGIPLAVRDIQVSVDRPQFTLNPTSCLKKTIASALWGGGLDPFSSFDDSPVARFQRFQAANCASLGFRPRFSLSLKGGTRRGGHPALTAQVRPRPGDANLARAVARFPRSTFLDQAHIRTVCTRVQFAASNCPPGSIYGRVKAFTPLLEEPLQGPVYLRSSENLLPDLVFDLHGLVDIEASARTDSVKGKLRVTFPSIPDAPISKVIVQMQGGKKGLLINSRNICAPVPRATFELRAHNGRERTLRSPLRAMGCRRATRQR